MLFQELLLIKKISPPYVCFSVLLPPNHFLFVSLLIFSEHNTYLTFLEAVWGTLGGT